MTQSTTDPYAVLGIKRQASAQQVRQAYRRLAKRYHPDLHPGGQTSDRMRHVNQAWQILSSPSRRARYEADNPRPGASSSGQWAGSPRRPSRRAASGRTWEAAWASAAEANGYPRTAAWADGFSAADRQAAARSSPDRPVVLVIVAVAFVVIWGSLVGFLPLPLFVIVLLFLASRIFGRFD
jgi:curved DNA-binding protein CbpA